MEKLKTLTFIACVMIFGSFASTSIERKAELKKAYLLRNIPSGDSPRIVKTDTELQLKIKNKLKSIKNLSDSIKNQQRSIVKKK